MLARLSIVAVLLSVPGRSRPTSGPTRSGPPPRPPARASPPRGWTRPRPTREKHGGGSGCVIRHGYLVKEWGSHDHALGHQVGDEGVARGHDPRARRGRRAGQARRPGAEALPGDRDREAGERQGLAQGDHRPPPGDDDRRVRRRPAAQARLSPRHRRASTATTRPTCSPSCSRSKYGEDLCRGLQAAGDGPDRRAARTSGAGGRISSGPSRSTTWPAASSRPGSPSPIAHWPASATSTCATAAGRTGRS